jgi:hypothetical protein
MYGLKVYDEGLRGIKGENDKLVEVGGGEGRRV